MSRRKQEKPQPRKSVLKGVGCEGAGVAPPDILTCGACRRDFPLHDIVRFIQHKVQRICDKENALLPPQEEEEEDEDEGGGLLLPLKKEEEVSSSSVAHHGTKTPKEPSSYVCSTCRQNLSSAWALIQHAQAAHGLSICEERAPLLERQPPPSQQEPPKAPATPPAPPLLLEPPPDPAVPHDSTYSQRLRSLASGGGLLQAHLTTVKEEPDANDQHHQNGAKSPESVAKSPENGLECEFCHKSFQFRSNLVVHRRSHTGEKPYRCSVCAHACTQASKLKRHMKTHRREGGGGGGITTNGTCRSDDDEEEERTNGELVIDDDEDEEEEPEDLTKKTSSSVIGEIMHLGLGRIPQFDEAYRQALREQRGGCSEGSNDAPSSRHSSPYDASRSCGQSPLGFDAASCSSFEQPKRLRLQADSNGGACHLYAGVWFPRVEQPYGGGAATCLDGSKSESALRGGVAVRGPGPNKEGGGSRRNDTCEFCGKVFKNCSNLTVHRRSHTGEKPYKCELCSYACAQSSKLTRHMKTHGRTGKDVYRCRFCDMPFSVASTLEKHMRKCVTSPVHGHAYLASSDDSKEMTAA